MTSSNSNNNTNSSNNSSNNHTYLRYDCTDAFGIAIAASSSSGAVVTHQIMSRTTTTTTTGNSSSSTLSKSSSSSSNNNTISSGSNRSSSSHRTICWTMANSMILGWDCSKSLVHPVYKIGHDQYSSGGGGSTAASVLNDNEISCMDTTTTTGSNSSSSSHSGSSGDGSSNGTQAVLIAAGYMDGTVRIFTVDITTPPRRSTSRSGPSSSITATATATGPIDWCQTPCLVLSGHSSPICSIAFNNHNNSSNSNLVVSGSNDGILIVWDLLQECGLFRLIGHSGPIGEVRFVNTPSGSTNTNNKEYLVSSCRGDSLMKIWDLQQQCCIQTLTKSRRSAGNNKTNNNNNNSVTMLPFIVVPVQQQQQRLITTTANQNCMVWSIGTKPPSIDIVVASSSSTTYDTDNNNNEENDEDDICHFMGVLRPPESTTATANDHDNGTISCIQYSPDKRYIGLLRTTTTSGSTNGSSKSCIDIYRILTSTESNKKRTRRLKRRQEKLKRTNKKQQQEEVDATTTTTTKNDGSKRGLMDDDDDDDDDTNYNNDDDPSSKTNDFDPDAIQVMDEFDYVTRVVATNTTSTTTSKKMQSFRFLNINHHRQMRNTTGIKNNNNNKKTKYQPNKHAVHHHHHPEELCRIVCANTNNTLETYSIRQEPKETGGTTGDGGSAGIVATTVVVVEPIDTLDFYGHTTGIRGIAISSSKEEGMCCTISKNHVKIWNIPTRTCIASMPLTVTTRREIEAQRPSASRKTTLQQQHYYGLCVLFLPGDTHVVVGTRNGALLLIDVNANEIIYCNDTAHSGPIWSIDIMKQQPHSVPAMGGVTSSLFASVIVSGSADKQVKFWNVESSTTTSENDDDDDDNTDYSTIASATKPTLRHTRTLQMADDVIAVKYSHSTDPTRKMLFVTTLDSTIKVFFDDSLKLFLSLYGHKLPALAMDCSDDDTILASGGADKTIKIWGLDFGDTHRTMQGHTDSITDLRFVRRTHYFFTCSKDNTVRYWDGDRFEQILLLNGHSAEVNCLAISRTGAFVLSAGMDRQVRVWERTKDIVFLEEERERELEQIFDRVNNRIEGGTGRIMDRKLQQQGNDDNEDDDGIINGDGDNEPQSEAAVRKSVTSVACGDRIMEAIERADQELKDIATFRKSHDPDQKRSPNLIMLSLEPAPYILWVLRTIKSAEIEQSLILLSLRHIERLMYYLILLLKAGQGTELCSRAAVFLVKAHQNQIIANTTMISPLRELQRLTRQRLCEIRDVAGFDLAALKMLSKIVQDQRNDRNSSSYNNTDVPVSDVWAGLGFGSDVAAALEGRPKRRS